MEAVTRVVGRAYPLGLKNIDTDVIIAAQHMKTITRAGLGQHAFAGLRAAPENLFDSPPYAGAPILIAGDNFGCGSSREHAAWALHDLGIQAIVAPSFSDIFSGNAFKNGIVTVVLNQKATDRLIEVAKDHPISIDLQTMMVTSPLQDCFAFKLDPFRRECLMQGLDEIDLTLACEAAIRNYEMNTSVLDAGSSKTGSSRDRC